MATPSSPSSDGASDGRRGRRRRETIEEALDHAIAIMAERGVGGLAISEMARRMGVQGPSLYKYFPSLHALYDALFARGLAAEAAAVRDAVDGIPPGLERIRVGMRANVRWCVENPALAQLLHWRPVPGFEPSPEVFAESVRDMADVRADFTEAVRRAELAPAADSDEAVRLLTVVLSGLISQQMANEPGAAFDSGRFTSLTDEAIDMFVEHYSPPRRP
jgi:AcrR family transcriptional regulator